MGIRAWKETLQSEIRSVDTTVMTMNTYHSAGLSGLLSALTQLRIYDFTIPRTVITLLIITPILQIKETEAEQNEAPCPRSKPLHIHQRQALGCEATWGSPSLPGNLLYWLHFCFLI